MRAQCDAQQLTARTINAERSARRVEHQLHVGNACSCASVYTFTFSPVPISIVTSDSNSARAIPLREEQQQRARTRHRPARALVQEIRRLCTVKR